MKKQEASRPASHEPLNIQAAANKAIMYIAWSAKIALM